MKLHTSQVHAEMNDITFSIQLFNFFLHYLTIQKINVKNKKVISKIIRSSSTRSKSTKNYS
jgi:hypothetical protein